MTIRSKQYTADSSLKKLFDLVITEEHCTIWIMLTSVDANPFLAYMQALACVFLVAIHGEFACYHDIMYLRVLTCYVLF